MFPLNTYNSCDHSHFPFTGNENPFISSSSPFFNFPAPPAAADHHQDQTFLADYDDNELFMNLLFSSQSQINNHLPSSSNVSNMVADHHHNEAPEIKVAPPAINKKTTSKKKENAGVVKGQAQVAGVPRKRGAGKKDRHSKIYTAQGLRDRRMRLSLQISRKFFDLQDMLGFDRASKTIEWLFSKSKAAIKDLTDSLPMSVKARILSSSNLESEAVSGIIINKSEDTGDQKSSGLLPPAVAAMKRSTPRAKSTTVNNPGARESREKARARARERTVKKTKLRSGIDQQKEANPNIEEKCQMDSDLSIIEKFLGITNSSPRSSPAMIFDYTHNIESLVDSNKLLLQNPGISFNINSLDKQEKESRSI